MSLSPSPEAYSPNEIARAAGVSVEQVVAALQSAGYSEGLVRHDDAVRIGRVVRRAPLFSIFATGIGTHRAKGFPLAVSSTFHAGLVSAMVFVTTLGFSPTAATLATDSKPEDMRLVFIATPGPGGGGGGGGLRQPAPPPKAMREGPRKLSSPLPVRRPPPPITPQPEPPPPPPPPPLASEPLPVLVAPIIAAPADNRDRIGALQESRAEAESRGPGQGGGVGSGAGTGIGPGDGSGVGPGSGGGTGGGPYRPGSGIQPPRLVREVKAEYPDEARRRAIEGEVVLEIIVRRDGSVGDVKILRRLGGGLDERAVQAVRQWRFAPATRLGAPVDVVVEVAVEFKLR
jgi:protein TonB